MWLYFAQVLPCKDAVKLPNITAVMITVYLRAEIDSHKTLIG